MLLGSKIVENQPLKILQKATNNLVLIKLKDGKEYRGRLKEIDVYMNLVLEGAEELENGNPIAKFGEVLIRGNNILYIKPDMTQIIWETKE
jgi:small nuclear ribonucleoprotein